jgi:hypothetical protein
MSLTGLPSEILSLILQTAVADAAIPSDILRVCQLFHDVGTECLYTHLKFTASKQLQLFAMTRAPETPLIVPRSVTVDLTGKQDFYVFRYLRDTFVKCKWLADEALARREGGDGDARMKRISLRMHSYARDTEVEFLAEGLCAVR